METTLSYLLVALAAATLLVTIYLAFRLKTVLYLLQQPVVKKMSPQLRLKPVKLDEALDRNRNRDRQGGPMGRDGARPQGRDDRRPEGSRGDGDRNRDGRPERRDGDRNRDGRPERRDGDRNRDGRPERSDRPERNEGRRDGDRNRDGRPERRDGDRREDRRPPREFSETRDAAPAAPAGYPAPASEAPSSLPARRPLPSFADAPIERAENPAPFRDPAADTFVGSGDDVQHGRRTQLKKKPRFDIDEAEATPAA